MTLLTPSELAERLKIHPGTLRRWRMDGEGPRWIKLGNAQSSAVRYELKDVEAWEKACQQKEGEK